MRRPTLGRICTLLATAAQSVSPTVAHLAVLLLAGGHLMAAPVAAQVRPDSVRTDTLRRPGAPADSARPRAPLLDSATQARAQRRIDSIETFRRGDTIKAPFARFEKPVSFEIDERLRFNREQILSSEATNLIELLDKVPGVISYRTGWLASAHLASYLGDFARIRVFMDGAELDAIDPRSNRILDFTDVHLWLLDEIVIERAAGEVRVWCRTTTQNRVTPYTRTDVFTGDLNTNGFRGLFGRRFMNGMALQVSGQQFATQQGRSSPFGTARTTGRGDGANQTLNARAGWAKRSWSFDVYGTVTTRDRDPQDGIDSTPDIAGFKGARREGYARLGYGDTANGIWAQAMWNSLRMRLEGIPDPEQEDTTIHSDTTRSREQRILAAGYRTKSWQASLTGRQRVFFGKTFNSPALRASYSTGLLSAGVFVEKTPHDSSQHADASVKFVPLPWIAVAASYTLRKFNKTTERDDEMITRLDGGLNWKKWWLTGGIVRQSSFEQVAPRLLVGNITNLRAGDVNGAPIASTAVLFGARGTIYKSFRLDIQGARWTNDLTYRPQITVRSDFSLTTAWLSRFPRGEFGFNAHVITEYRDPFDFPYFGCSTAEKPTCIRSQVARPITALVEIRIQRAVIFYQFHNVSGQPYEYVPGIVMPRQVQMYGVRWDFWN